MFLDYFKNGELEGVSFSWIGPGYVQAHNKSNQRKFVTFGKYYEDETRNIAEISPGGSMFFLFLNDEKKGVYFKVDDSNPFDLKRKKRNAC